MPRTLDKFSKALQILPGNGKFSLTLITRQNLENAGT